MGDDAAHAATLSVDGLRGAGSLVMIDWRTGTYDTPAFTAGASVAGLAALRTVILPHGEIIPAQGQGTWQVAEDRRRESDGIAALRLGLT